MTIDEIAIRDRKVPFLCLFLNAIAAYTINVLIFVIIDGRLCKN